jgi:hypothetical protein
MYSTSRVATWVRLMAAAMLVAVGLFYAYSAAVHWNSSWAPRGRHPELEAWTAARRAGYAAVLILGGVWVFKSVMKRVGRQARHCAGRAGFEAVQNLVAHAGLTIEEAEYHHLAFGSWSIRVSNEPAMRLAWDGKEECAAVEVETESSPPGRPIWKTIWTGRRRDEQSASNMVKVLVEHLHHDQPS